ncbi:MAG: hypothetical protein ACE5HC_04410 [Candidatus Binatia bacterium]
MDLFKETDNNPFSLLNLEISKLKEVLLTQTYGIELDLKQAKSSTTAEAQHAEQVIGHLESEIVGLEAELTERVEMLQTRESLIKELEEKLAGQTSDFEDRLREKDALLKLRDQELCEKNALMRAKEEESRSLLERILAETEKLRSELKEKKIHLAVTEREQRRAKKRRTDKHWKL